jgi:hypothetical protein
LKSKILFNFICSKSKEIYENRKKLNLKNENDNKENKKLLKEGKLNVWEAVVDNIAIKESDYKGTKDVNRMKEVIINRKNDNINENKLSS